MWRCRLCSLAHAPNNSSAGQAPKTKPRPATKVTAIIPYNHRPSKLSRTHLLGGQGGVQDLQQSYNVGEWLPDVDCAVPTRGYREGSVRLVVWWLGSLGMEKNI